MKKSIAIIMALVCSLALVSVAFAAEEAPAYDYSKDPLVALQTPLGSTDYANGNMVYALQNVVDKDGNVVTEDMIDEYGDPVYTDASQTEIQQQPKTEIQKDENGEPVVYLGAPCKAIYQIATGKVFKLNDVPKEKTPVYAKDENGKVVVDDNDEKVVESYKKYKLEEGGNDGSVKYEGITISAYYAVNCPSCKQANGGYSYLGIYQANAGACKHCGYKFPSPSDESMKFYRFIVVDEESKYYSKFREYNFTSAAKAVFGDSAKYYGDGTDLPQQYLVYEGVFDETAVGENGEIGAKVETLTGYKTSGKTKNGTMANVHILLTKIGYRFEPMYAFMGESLFVQLRANMANMFFGFIDKILHIPFT